MKKNVFKKFVVLLFVAVMLFSVSVPASAATKQPYKDVILNSTVGSYDYHAIAFLKKYGAFKGIVKGKYFHPEKPATRKWYLKLAVRLFGKKNVPITKADKKKYNKHISNVRVAKKGQEIIKKITGVSVNLLPSMLLYNYPRSSVSSSLYALIKNYKGVRKVFKKRLELAKAN